jgi:UV DNA damage endonuclease
MKPAERRRKLASLCLANAAALLEALRWCAAHGVGCFRIVSSILPMKTHPVAGYRVDDLPNAADVVAAFRRCGEFARMHDVRLTFHPDQFIVLNSPREEVVRKSLEDLEYHAEVSEWVGADVVNIHGGGAYGDKGAALERLARALDRLSHSARSLLTLENDDKIFTPSDLLPLCRAAGVPLTYDVHHHRCLPDRLTVEEATHQARATWNREPLFHVSSPESGWSGADPSKHDDWIALEDFPACWKALDVSVEVEARAKELAVLRLMRDLHPLGPPGGGSSAAGSRGARRIGRPTAAGRPRRRAVRIAGGFEQRGGAPPGGLGGRRGRRPATR